MTGSARAGRFAGGREEIDINGVVAWPASETDPRASASASARSKTVSRVFRSYIARKAQFREVISQGRSGPGRRAQPGPHPDDGSLRGHRAMIQDQVGVQIVGRETLEGTARRPCRRPRSRTRSSATRPLPSSACSAIPPVIRTDSWRRQTGRSTRRENKVARPALSRIRLGGWRSERDQIACEVCRRARGRELTARQDQVPVLDMDQVLETRGLVVTQNEIGNDQGAPVRARSMPDRSRWARATTTGVRPRPGARRESPARVRRQSYRRESMGARANHAEPGRASAPGVSRSRKKYPQVAAPGLGPTCRKSAPMGRSPESTSSRGRRPFRSLPGLLGPSVAAEPRSRLPDRRAFLRLVPGARTPSPPAGGSRET